MLYQPWSYQITIDENPIPLKRICVLSYLCLLLTKELFETSFRSFQYNIKGRRLSNYSIKLILCSHYCLRYKGLCQNKKHGFYYFTKGGNFCAAHIALMAENSNQLHEKGLLVSRTLVNTEKNILPLRIFNFCGEDITIKKKNTAAAKLVPVEIHHKNHSVKIRLAPWIL